MMPIVFYLIAQVRGLGIFQRELYQVVFCFLSTPCSVLTA